MAIDNKYGKINFTEANTIGEDEPVVVFRAADPLLPSVMLAYAELCQQQRSPKVHVDLVEDTRQKIVDWQMSHQDLVRTKPTSSNWDGKNRIDTTGS